jgi:hypothetical protein
MRRGLTSFLIAGEKNLHRRCELSLPWQYGRWPVVRVQRAVFGERKENVPTASGMTIALSSPGWLLLREEQAASQGKETIMATKKTRHPHMPNTGNEEIPPGATTRAADRPVHKGGAPGSGAGPRHAADDPGTPDEEYGAVDSNDPLADGTLVDPNVPKEKEPEAYGGSAGGAVGGTPANKRAAGGRRD